MHKRKFRLVLLATLFGELIKMSFLTSVCTIGKLYYIGGRLTCTTIDLNSEHKFLGSHRRWSVASRFLANRQFYFAFIVWSILIGGDRRNNRAIIWWIISKCSVCKCDAHKLINKSKLLMRQFCAHAQSMRIFQFQSEPGNLRRRCQTCSQIFLETLPLRLRATETVHSVISFTIVGKTVPSELPPFLLCAREWKRDFLGRRQAPVYKLES